MPCPLCRAPGRPFLAIPDYPVFANALDAPAEQDELYRFEVELCASCALGYQTHPPSPDKLYTRARAPSGVSKVWRDHYEALTAFAGRGGAARGRRVLDVGAGHGFFSGVLREAGWSVEAVDRNPGERLLGLGFPVHQAAFGEGEPVLRGFDAVTMSHVIEHASDLDGFLRHAAAALAPGGEMILSVPDTIGGLITNDLSMFIPEHTWYFSERSLRVVLRRAGFEVVDWDRYQDHSLFARARAGGAAGGPPERETVARAADLCGAYTAAFDRTLRRVEGICARTEGRVVFFGAHSMMLHCLVPLKPWDRFRREFALVDNDPAKRGLRLSGTPWTVRRPDEAGLCPRDTVVIPQSPYAEEMRAQAEAYGAACEILR